jgi:hypothetical protein
VLLKIVYLLVRRILGLAVLVLRGEGAKEAELLMLRHENAVLRRHVAFGAAGSRCVHGSPAVHGYIADSVRP